MNNDKPSGTVKTGGIGFFGLLGLLFITLKLLNITAVATWSWLWVLSPLWIPLSIAVIVFIIAAAVAVYAISGIRK